MKIRGFLKTYRFIRLIKKYKNVRGTWKLVYPHKGLRYDLEFVANAKQAQKIIKGFIKSVKKEIN